MGKPTRVFNFNDVKQAREFLDSLELQKNGKTEKVTFVTLESGRDLPFKDMTDDEAKHYAGELAPMFGAREMSVRRG